MGTERDAFTEEPVRRRYTARHIRLHMQPRTASRGWSEGNPRMRTIAISKTTHEKGQKACGKKLEDPGFLRDSGRRAWISFCHSRMHHLGLESRFPRGENRTRGSGRTDSSGKPRGCLIVDPSCTRTAAWDSGVDTGFDGGFEPDFEDFWWTRRQCYLSLSRSGEADLCLLVGHAILFLC